MPGFVGGIYTERQMIFLHAAPSPLFGARSVSTEVTAPSGGATEEELWCVRLKKLAMDQVGQGTGAPIPHVCRHMDLFQISASPSKYGL